MDRAEITSLSATELATYIETKQVSPVEAVEAYLDRIEQLNPVVNAYVTVCAEEARRDARQAEEEIQQGRYRGPLHGVPVAIKDQIHTKGIRTTDGSKLRATFVPEEDATVMANLKKAGAILLGKLNMSEFALGDPVSSASGAARNPWDLERSPGTSSTGSGAATAAHLCATSLGEDTGGSIRGDRRPTVGWWGCVQPGVASAVMAWTELVGPSTPSAPSRGRWRTAPLPSAR